MPVHHVNCLLRHPFSLQRTTTTLLTRQARHPSSSQSLRRTQTLNRQHAHRTFTTTNPRPSFTLSQLLRTTRPGRRKSREKPRSPILSTTKRPHMSGVCLRVGVTKPKKPNSGERKTCRVRLSNGKVVDAFIPGEGHNVQQHSVVLVRGGRLQDCPGVRYKCVRGAKQGDLGGVASRRAGRSKYGTKMPKTG